MRLGKFDEARQFLEKADSLAPQNIERINDMTNMYLELEEPDEAVKKMKEAMALHPEDPDLKFNMFSKLFNKGFDSHAVDFGKENAKPMEIVRHYNNKGVMLSKSDDRSGAIQEYNRALRFFPKFKENYRILFNIALAQAQEKSLPGYQEAEKNLKMCLELKPDFEKAKNTLEVVQKVLSKNKAS